MHSGNGGEYINSFLKHFCEKGGIVLTTTTPYNPESNGLAEKMNRTILFKVRTILSESRLSKNFWAEAVKHTAYFQNLTPIGKCTLSPIEWLADKKPDVSHLRMFGCLVQEHIPNELRKKLEPKSKKLTFIGHISPTLSKGFDLESKAVVMV